MGAIDNFQKAGEYYKALGMKDKAVIAFEKYSLCSEKINELYGAAEGLTQAAFCEDNKE